LSLSPADDIRPGGPPLRVTAISVAIGGDAVARDGTGTVVFVDGALEGETVDAVVYEEHKSYRRAVATQVLDPSPDRALPPCPYVQQGCGGCGWQHIAPGAQVRMKLSLVAQALRRIGRIAEPHVEAGPRLPASGYRTSLRAAVGPSGRPAFRRTRRHEVLEVDSCWVAHPLLVELLARGRFGTATEAVLRCGARTGERLAVLSPTAAEADFGSLARVVGDDELKAGRRAWISEEVAGARLRVSARSFFQARPDGAEALVSLVAEALSDVPDGPFVDAYGGVGLFAATVAKGERPVTLLENSSSAVADARVNVPGARVVQIDVARWRPHGATAVVADPPRAGLGPKAVDVLAATGAARLALVSCDPASLGRDAGLLGKHGFELLQTTVVDMFPGTPHIETVSSFAR
jgi:23S rRNA (uracil1939-C5)-methyltransferase